MEAYGDGSPVGHPLLGLRLAQGVLKFGNCGFAGDFIITGGIARLSSRILDAH
jgi:hypothetical protein